ncbi:MAG: filamentous hemagglutinin N-terminal domain-containing protein, partial [Rhodocyclaceae bacterium]|nr:filamentous hemagglutinin N-terminal domain-containing protein [Rhodocyclaceae bacterium]
MNKTYRLVWNECSLSWVAAAENVRARGKRASGAVVLAALLGTATAATAQTPPQPAQLPTGGRVVGGQAAIAQSGAVMNITQSSQRAAIDWQTFNVGSQAQVNFLQPGRSSVALNRVLDSNPSQIFGRIQANGQVFLSNPSGIYFAPGASVNVGGLVATTHSISLDNFMAGRYSFERQGATGSVINAGELTSDLGGYIALLAPEVRNQGVIVAQAGSVALGAGEAFELQFDGNNTLAGLRVEPASLRALVDNRSAVLAPGGLVILSARAVNALQGSVVNSGAVSASSLVSKGGRIVLEGDDIALKTGSSLQAAGATGGGEVLVGGDWAGSGGMHQATRVSMEAGASLDVSATRSGDGGKAVLWSDVSKPDSRTEVHGHILARGGPQGGNGGRIETSGHTLDITGVSGDASAARGQGGQWLMDPGNITLAAGSGTDSNCTFSAGACTASGSSTVYESNIEALLNAGTSVTIATGTGSNYNIGLESGLTIDKTAGGDATLSLAAAGRIYALGSTYAITSTSGRLNVVLSSNINGGALGVAVGNISTNGGGLWVGGGALNGSWVPYAGGSAIAVGTSNAGGGGSGGNQNAVDIVGNVDTRAYLGGVAQATGGHILIDAVTSASGTATDIAPISANQSFSTGDGNITFIQSELNYNAGGFGLTLDSTGALTIQPWSNYFYANAASGTPVAVTLSGSTSGGNFTGSGSLAGLTINSVAGLGGLSIGSASSSTNSDVTIASPLSIAGPISVYGGAITANADLSTTGSGSGILLKASGSIATAAGSSSAAPLSFQTSGGDITMWSDADANASGNIFIGQYNRLASDGGKITLGGGSGTTAPTGYAYGTATAQTISTDAHQDGISLRQSTLDSRIYSGSTPLASGGGSITLQGLGYAGNMTKHGGGIWSSLSTIQSGGGAVLLSGVSQRNGGATNGSGGIRYGAYLEGLTIGTNGGSLDVIGTSNNVSDTSVYLANNASVGNVYDAGSGALTLQADSFSFGSGPSQSLQGSGPASIWSRGSTFTTALSTANLSFASTLSSLTIGRTTETASITLGSATSIAGPITIYGGSVAVNANLTSTGAGSAVLLKASGSITQAASVAVTTDGGNVTYWADSDASGAGGIYVSDNASIDTRTSTARDASLVSTATGGGRITLAGGLDDGGTASSITGRTAGDGRPDGYAANLSGLSANSGGVLLGTDAGVGSSSYSSGVTLRSGGGDVFIAGSSSQSVNSNSIGVFAYRGLTLDAGTGGSVAMWGKATGAASWGSMGIDFSNGYYNASSTAATYVLTAGSGSISLNGSAQNGGFNRGVDLSGPATGVTRLAASGSGGVSITGTASGSSPIDVYLGNDALLAASGAIALTGTGSGGLQVAAASTLGADGAAVPASSSAVTLTGNAINLGAATTLTTTGAATLQPFGSDFSSAFTFGSNMVLASTVGGLTIGKAATGANGSSDANVTIASPIGIAGPISVYGGTIVVNA